LVISCAPVSGVAGSRRFSITGITGDVSAAPGSRRTVEVLAVRLGWSPLLVVSSGQGQLNTPLCAEEITTSAIPGTDTWMALTSMPAEPGAGFCSLSVIVAVPIQMTVFGATVAVSCGTPPMVSDPMVTPPDVLALGPPRPQTLSEKARTMVAWMTGRPMIPTVRSSVVAWPVDFAFPVVTAAVSAEAETSGVDTEAVLFSVWDLDAVETFPVSLTTIGGSRAGLVERASDLPV
jgi:hypothetical protein